MNEPTHPQALPSRPDGDTIVAALMGAGFDLDVEQVLRVHVLLDRLEPVVEGSRLRTLLCPLVVGNRNEQERFYEVFDRLFVRESSDPGPPPPAGPSKATSETHVSRAPLVLAALIAMACSLVWLFVVSKDEPTPEPPPDQPPISVMPPVVPSTTAPTQRPQSNTAAAESVAPVQSNGTRWITLLPVAAASAAELFRWQRRRRRRRRQRVLGPPYRWSLDVPVAWSAHGSQAALAARHLRRGQGSHAFDLEDSVIATAERGGYPSQRFRRATRAVEYFALIERRSEADHQARLHRSIVAALQSEGLSIESFWFHDDPRMLESTTSSETIRLQDLHARQPGRRLLVFGTGEEMFDTLTGEPQLWIRLFQSREERAYLSASLAADRPDRMAERLAEHFTLVPATLEGLRRLGTMSEWALGSAEGPMRSLPSHPTRRRQQLDSGIGRGELTDKWSAACALYPELQWELSLYLATMPALGGGLLLSERGISRLASLSWFRSGYMPPDVRARLAGDLTPETRRRIRQVLLDLLSRTDVPSQSWALEQIATRTVLQQAALDPVAARSRLRELADRDLFSDATVAASLGLLERQSDQQLLRRILYRGGVPLLGARSWTRMAAACALSFALWIYLDSPSPIADEPSPSLQSSRKQIPLAAPVELTYTWRLSPDAALPAPGTRVLVHFIDSQGVLLFDDDHDPVPPITAWERGGAYSYHRTFFVPLYPYVGPVDVRMQLYGAGGGMKFQEYSVAALELLPQTENLFIVYKDGWHSPEISAADPSAEHTWTMGSALVSFKNPGVDVVVYIEADTCVECFSSPPILTISINGARLRLPFNTSSTALARVEFRAEDLGDEPWVDLRLALKDSFIPAKVRNPPTNAHDDRELGIRVHHLYVGTKDGIGAIPEENTYQASSSP